MLIGDTSDFAIEVMVEPELKIPSAVWGRMCIRIGDATLGDFDERHCGLTDASGRFDWHAKQTDRLWDNVFDDMTPEQIHDTVRDAIYGDDERSMEQIQRDSLRFGNFDFLTNWGEQFDSFSSVIVSPDSDTMMILHRPYANPDSTRRLPGDFVIARCTRSGFISASEEFVAWFDREEERLSPDSCI